MLYEENHKQTESHPHGIIAYQLTSLRASSDKYGTCDVCQMEVGEIFILRPQRWFVCIVNGVDFSGWSSLRAIFGHHDCLINIIKQRRAEQ